MRQPTWTKGPVPPGFWKKTANHRAYMQWLGEQLEFNEPQDWYQLKGSHFLENHGSGLINNYYSGSPIAAVREFLPDYDWKEWLFPNTTQGFWQSPENHRAYMEWLGRSSFGGERHFIGNSIR